MTEERIKMRKDYDIDDEKMQEAEDDFYNYYREDKKKSYTVPVIAGMAVIMLLAGFVIGKGSNLLTRSQNEADRDVKQAQDVAAQTKTDQTSSDDTNTGNANVKQMFISGYNEELTDKVEGVVNEIYPEAAQSQYSEQLTEACIDGTIDGEAQQIIEDSGNPEGYFYMNCDMGGDFDRDALLNGLNNERVKQETVSAYWVGAVAENSGDKVYLFFER